MTATTDAVEILHRIFIKGDPRRLASIKEERDKIIRNVGGSSIGRVPGCDPGDMDSSPIRHLNIGGHRSG